ISRPLCGISRPGHFRGVATIVLKLLNIVSPRRAYFGQKDFQQLQVIRTMVRDLNVNTEIVSCPVIREADGLAMSSRNAYLNDSERAQAAILYESMVTAKMLFESGETSPEIIHKSIIDRIAMEPDASIDYAKLVDPRTLEDAKKVQIGTVIALAVKIGKTRLIDNMVL
ncbi:MAG: pantoate--beta-alanine ligase, partial [Desulfomonilaceae bacterium]